MDIRLPFDGIFPITQPFGVNADSYKQFFVTKPDGTKLYLKGHDGIDFAVPSDTRVVAPHDGTVTQVAFDEHGYGWYIVIENDQVGSIIAHMKEVVAKVGWNVIKGDTLGQSDNTGNSTGPHVHWGFYHKPRNVYTDFFGYEDQYPLIASIFDASTPVQPVEPPVTYNAFQNVTYQIPATDKKEDWLPVKVTDFKGMRTKCDKYDKMVERGYFEIDDITKRIEGLKNARTNDCSLLEEENRKLKEEISDKTIRIKTILAEWTDYVSKESAAVDSGIKAEEEKKQLEEIKDTVAEKLDITPEKVSFFSILKKLDFVTEMADRWQKAKEQEATAKVKTKSKIVTLFQLIGVKI